MKLRKGSPEAKAYMAKLRAMAAKRREIRAGENLPSIHPSKTLDLSGRHVYGAGKRGCQCYRCTGKAPRRNPPSFVVIDSGTGRVMYTKRATGMGDAAIKSASEAAKRFAKSSGRSQIVFLDIRGAKVGMTTSVPLTRALGITEEVFPDGRVTLGNPLTKRERLELEKAARFDRGVAGRYRETGRPVMAAQYDGRANRGEEIAHNLSPLQNPGKHRFHEVPGPAAGRPAFNTKCVACGKPLMLGRDRVHADLNGPSFKAYYCSACKASAETKNPPGRSRSEKAIDKEIESAYYRHASGTQISVLDIPKLFRDVRAELASGQNIDESVIRAIARYRVGDEPKKNPAVLIRTPAKLEAERIASWISREGVLARVAPAGGEWGVFVPRHQEAAGKKTLGRVLSKNPSLSVRCNPVACKNPGHRHMKKNPLLQMVTLANPGGLGTLTRGDRLPVNLQREVLNRFVYRWTNENSHRFDVYRCPICKVPGGDPNGGAKCRQYHPTIPLISDAKWLREHSFYVTRDGRLSSRQRHAEPSLDNPETNPLNRAEAAWLVRSGKRDIDQMGATYSGAKLTKAGKAFMAGRGAGKAVAAKLFGPERATAAAERVMGRGYKRMSALKNPLRPKGVPYCAMCGNWSKSKGPYKRAEGYCGWVTSQPLCRNCRSGVAQLQAEGYDFRGKGGYKSTPIGKIRHNPAPASVPFRHGQIITVDQALAYARKSGNASLTKQLQESIALCKKANGKPLKVRFDLIAMGDPKKIDAVMAGVEYGQTDETVYKPPAGSKKGKHLYKHDWGEGTGKRKPVPLIATPGGKALVMPLRSGQKASDWLRG